MIILTILSLIGCNSDPEKEFEKDKTFPEVKSLTEYKQTTFLPTLETSFETKKNGIYAASLLMAWNEIRNEISEPIKEFSSDELELINNSDSYKNVLSNTEYSSSIEMEDLTIRAKAYFKKSLPFVIPLKKDNEPLQFLNDNVISFGFYGHNKASRILYYNNDNDFAIKLLPKDNEHEIILMKSHFKDNLILKSEIERLDNLKKDFKKKRNDKNYWKYYFNDEDRVSIPIIEFNIETNYPKIEGSYFSTDQRQFIVDLMYQRTAFILNENGAEIESKAEVAVKKAMEEELPKPKNMIFNKPYLIVLKRKDGKCPYFSMFVSNSELMKKE